MGVAGAAMFLAPTTYAQTGEWKTYLNPDYKLSLQYPNNLFGEEEDEISEIDNSTNFNLIGDNIQIYLSMIPLNSTGSKANMALYYIENTFRGLMDDDDIHSIQNITEVMYGDLKGYKTILDAGDGSIYGYATIQYDDAVLFFYMFNADRSNYQGDLFYKIVNTTKFF